MSSNYLSANYRDKNANKKTLDTKKVQMLL